MQQASSSFRELCVFPASGQQRTWPIPVGLLRLSLSAAFQPTRMLKITTQYRTDQVSSPVRTSTTSAIPKTARGTPLSPRLHGRRGTSHGGASQEITASLTANSAIVPAP